MSRTVKKQENMAYNQEKNQSVKTFWGIIEMML